MKKQYIKVPIPEAISEEGGASILCVNKQTVPLDGAVKEPLAGNYCTGQATLIRNFFFGLMQSMADGVRRGGGGGGWRGGRSRKIRLRPPSLLQQLRSCDFP